MTVDKLTEKEFKAYQQHVVSQLHIERAAKVFHLEKPSKKKLQEENKDREVFICDLCFCSCNGQVSWNSHLMGQKHRKKVEQQQELHSKLAKAQMEGYTFGKPGSDGGKPSKDKFGRPIPDGKAGHATITRGGSHQAFGRGGSQSASMRGRGGSQLAAMRGRGGSQSAPTRGASQSASARGGGPHKPIKGPVDFQNYPEPLIGLEYVAEIAAEGDTRRFHCTLCDCKFDNNLKFPHLVGAKHRLNVIRTRDPDWAKEIQESCDKRSELTGKLLQVAKQIESAEGRQSIQMKQDFLPETVQRLGGKNRPNPRKRDHTPSDSDYDNAYGAKKQKTQAGNTAADRNNPSATGFRRMDPLSAEAESTVDHPSSKSSLLSNLSELTKCLITNEEDAAIALQVSNALTQALLAYRMRNISEEARRQMKDDE